MKIKKYKYQIMQTVAKYIHHMARHMVAAHRKFSSQPSQQKPPISEHGDALFSFVNNSGKTAYIQVVGRDPNTKQDFFVKYNSDGTFEYSPASPGEKSSPFAFSSTFFTDGSFYLPTGDGMRLYVSIDTPLEFMVNTTINGPDPHNPSDPNHDILWDKIEFNVGPNSVFTNPTAVDSFSLPLHIKQTDKSGVVQEGGLTVNRTKIFDDFKTAFAGTQFTGLVANDGRVVFSPKDGAATRFFPNDYLVTSGWFDAFKKLFSKEEIIVDMEESFTPVLGGGIWRGLVENDHIIFIRDEDEKHPKVDHVTIGIPNTITEWIGGDGPAWLADTDLKRAMVRNISAAAETNTLTTKVPLSAVYFASKRGDFYKINSELPTDLQFCDLYSKVLHSYGQDVYSYGYDDELGQSGSCNTFPTRFASGTITLSGIN
jgi:hypothetical protein